MPWWILSTAISSGTIRVIHQDLREKLCDVELTLCFPHVQLSPLLAQGLLFVHVGAHSAAYYDIRRCRYTAHQEVQNVAGSALLLCIAAMSDPEAARGMKWNFVLPADESDVVLVKMNDEIRTNMYNDMFIAMLVFCHGITSPTSIVG